MRIMIVDDEPFFLENLKEAIHSCCSQLRISFEIVAECYQAELALEQIPYTLPDLVFTDIRMDAMNGLELARKLQEAHPLIITIIVSGYSTFEHAHQAMKAKVSDYLVKPIEEEALKQVLVKTAAHIQLHRQERQRTLLQLLLDCRGEETPAATTGTCKDGEGACREAATVNLDYAVFVLMGLTSSELILNSSAALADALFNSRSAGFLGELLLTDEGYWPLIGPARYEPLLLLGLQNYDKERLATIARQLITANSNTRSKVTMGISPGISSLTELPEAAQLLTKSLYRIHTIGKSKLFFLEEFPPEASFASFTFPGNVEEKELAMLAEHRDWPAINRLVQQLFSVWSEEGCPTFLIELSLRKVIHGISASMYQVTPVQIQEAEETIQEMLWTASSFTEAAEASLTRLEALFYSEKPRQGRGSAVLFLQIQQYIAAHIDKPLTLSLLMDEFGISSTYLCNLFRIHNGLSFVEYFTSERIIQAQELLQKHQGMPIREVAELVGYQDPYYFSKVFKKITGLSPSDYRWSRESTPID